MAGLFKTGKELQAERMAEMRANSIKMAKSMGGSARDQTGRMLGSGLVTGLAGLFMDKTGGVAAGDIEKQAIEGGADPQTSTGLLAIQRAMFDAGDNESALALDKHIKDRLTIENSLTKAKDSAGGKASTVSPPSGNELSATRSTMFAVDNDFSQNLASMLESEDPFKVSQVDNMVNGVATTVKTIESRLKDKGLIVNPHELRTAAMEMLAASDTTSDSSWFGGFFGKDGVINVEEQNKTFKRLEKGIYDQFLAVGNKATDAPVKTAPGTKGTGQKSPDMLPEDSLEDIQGKVSGAGQGQEKGTPVSEVESKAMGVIDQQIAARYAALQKATDPKLQAVLKDQLTQLGLRKATLSRSMSGLVSE